MCVYMEPSPPRPISLLVFGVLSGQIFLFQAAGFIAALLGIRHRIVSVATASFLFNPFLLLNPSEQLTLQVASVVSFTAGGLLILLAWLVFRDPGKTRKYSSMSLLASAATIIVPGFSLGAFLGSLVGLMGLGSPSRPSVEPSVFRK